MGGLRIVTYDCRGIKSSLPVIHELCTDNDIVLLRKLYSVITTYILLTLYILIFLLAVVLRLTPAKILLWAGHMVGVVLCGENHLAPLSPRNNTHRES